MKKIQMYKVFNVKTKEVVLSRVEYLTALKLVHSHIVFVMLKTK